MNRRQFVVATATGAMLGLAGCLGDDDSETNSPESVVEAYVRAQFDGDTTEFLHTESPLGGTDGGDPATPGEITAVATTLLEEGLDVETLEREFPQLGAEATETIAEQDNATVRATVVRSLDDETAEEEWVYLTAREGDEWRVVIFDVELGDPQ